MPNIFLFNKLFEENNIFWENREKLFWRRIWQIFRERRRLVSKINITFFIANEILNILLFSSFFKKSCSFLRKRQKTVSGAQVSFEGKNASGDENEYNHFYEKWEMGKKNFGGDMTIFEEKGAYYAKNEYNLFYRKVDTKYFYVK